MPFTVQDLEKIADNIAKDIPIVGGKVKKALHDLIESDGLNHNGVPDVLEILMVAEGLISPLEKIEQSIDFDEVKKELEAAEHAAIKNKALLLEALADLQKLAEAAKHIAGK